QPDRAGGDRQRDHRRARGGAGQRQDGRGRRLRERPPRRRRVREGRARAALVPGRARHDSRGQADPSRARQQPVRRLTAGVLRGVLYIAIAVVIVWSVAAIWLDGPMNGVLAAVLCGLIAAGSLLVLVLVRPWWWAAVGAVIPFVIVLAWWLSLAPSNTRNWQPDVARLPSAQIHDNIVTIQNVRNFAYPSATTAVERWE